MSPFLLGCDRFFFYPSKTEFSNPYLDRYKPSHIFFTTADGTRLHGILLRPKTISRAAVLYLHGNAQNLSTQIYNILWLVDAGFTVFAVDYRGFGESEGSPNIKGVNLDASAALNELLDLCPGQRRKIIVFGQSIGGAIAIYTVANTPYKNDIKALIVDSAFSSYRAIAREKLGSIFLRGSVLSLLTLPLAVTPANIAGIFLFPISYPLSYTVTDSYSPLKWIDKVTPVPLLIVYGSNDPIIPTHHSEELFKKAMQPKDIWSTDMAGHTNFFSDDGNRKALIKYLESKL